MTRDQQANGDLVDIFRHLDGLMDLEEAIEFEQRLFSDAQLAAEYESLADMDELSRRSLHLQAEEPLPAPRAIPSAALWMAVAAGLVVLAGALRFLIGPPVPTAHLEAVAALPSEAVLSEWLIEMGHDGRLPEDFRSPSSGMSTEDLAQAAKEVLAEVESRTGKALAQDTRSAQGTYFQIALKCAKPAYGFALGVDDRGGVNVLTSTLNDRRVFGPFIVGATQWLPAPPLTWNSAEGSFAFDGGFPMPFQAKRMQVLLATSLDSIRAEQLDAIESLREELAKSTHPLESRVASAMDWLTENGYEVSQFSVQSP